MKSSNNPMRDIKINKLVINIGTGSDEQLQNNAKKLIELITGRKPASAISKKRIPTFKITKGQKIGAFVTIRGEEARPLLVRLFDAVDNKIKENSITDNTLNFGIREYIDISGVKYDPKIGMLGMHVNLSFKRDGLRTESRKRRASYVPLKHRGIPVQEIRDYIQKEFNVTTTQ